MSFKLVEVQVLSSAPYKNPQLVWGFLYAGIGNPIGVSRAPYPQAPVLVRNLGSADLPIGNGVVAVAISIECVVAQAVDRAAGNV